MKKKIYILIGLLMMSAACAFQKDIRNQKIERFDQLVYPFKVKKVTLDNDMEIAYMDEGKGDEVLLFVHGLGSYAPAWKKNINELSQLYRCVAMDLPGYGKSSKGNYDVSMSNYADIINAFLQKIKVDKVTLLGHSMGGQISIMTALAYPQVVQRLVLVAPAGFETFTPGQKQWFREVLTPTAVKLTTVDQIKANIGWNFYDMPDDAFFMVEDRIAMRDAVDFDAYCYIIPECVKAMVNEPVFDYLDRLTQPTLVVFGADDNLIPNRYLNPGTTEAIAKQGAEKIKNAQLHLIPQAGHFVQFEKASQVNNLIRTFINEGE